eukprot:TRINITY_DN24925_c0_g1_i1.p1 TRINITY_DN24925_c0_g1~~TRINITY_DN24925_c0_g1_i1.p1  ORF type:complete len:299 (+),score=72.01 TRINITY_DN24925_c0_g1_i1:55-897(+)
MVSTQAFDALFEAGRAAPLTDIKGKWALVSGASSGIGKATACALAACGCNIYLLARRRDKLEEIKTEIDKRSLGVEVKVVDGDVNADETYEKLKKAGAMETIDFLINNAGLAVGKDPVGGANLQDWKTMMDANCFGAFRLANEVLPGIFARGGGHVVMTGSIAGLEAYEGGSVYCASKHAAHAFMKALRYETYAKNVRCTVVAPGFVGEGTEFSEVRFKGDQEKVAATYAGMQELRATDVAAQIVWALRQPAHVCLDMIHVMPTCQGGATRIHRQPTGGY